MTVGEKIQYYRKRSGLSQEELGQEMLVSRQTVSLWEMNKTLPTVDNLMRLKEIFSVSVDELLSEDEPNEDSKTEPKETYTFKYEKSDLKKVFRAIRFPLIKRAVFFTLACVGLYLILLALEAPDVMLGLSLGLFLLGLVSYTKSFFAYSRMCRSSESRILKSNYFYEIFEGYFILTVSQNDEITRRHKINLNDIEKIQDLGNFLVLQIASQSYIIKKDALSPDSAFISLLNNDKNKSVVYSSRDKFTMLSNLLFVLSICTIFGALLVVAILTGINQLMGENMWVFFLFLPIPMASVGFGFYLKKKGYRYKKNVIVGIIMGALLCIYGSFVFII